MENYIDKKVALAKAYFTQGYNCAQSVFMAFCEDFGVDLAMGAKISASFGGGIGRLREVCGAVSGMAMCASFLSPADNPSDHDARTRNYALAREFAEKFRSENGDIVCRRLLGLPDNANESPEPSKRTAEYYKKR
ncbi:MAG: C_GCAxxG_C_C family protein, partial [Bacteroidales bacterium]|nr:C_GCAxxG_C_C family protein [Bacteroidales bacterium]